MTKGFFTYIRVSTLKQGEHGVSLTEQRATIERYARESNLFINKHFEDRESAAVEGRVAFNVMLSELRAGQATGVIFYKVDRSSRNATDWAAIDVLADRGFDVHFAHDRLLLSRRGDRLTANMQAVVAADESRTIRERVTMGYYGRLKEGLLPRPAPLGYFNNGKAQPKTIDPRTGPLIQRLFELYATGRFTLRTLQLQATKFGLKTRKSGAPLRATHLDDILRNPFYAGVIRVAKTGQTFRGIHEPLVSGSLFDRVQRILHGKAPKRVVVHDFLFRRLLTCEPCGRRLIGELQKRRVYYRCQTRECPTTTVREDVAEGSLLELLRRLKPASKDQQELLEVLHELRHDELQQRSAREQARQLQIKNVAARERRLLDAWMEGLIEKADLEERKMALLMERRALEDATASDSTEIVAGEQNFLELASNACLLYENALHDERRELIEIVTSNRFVHGRTPIFTLRSAFADWANALEMQSGGPYRDTARTRQRAKRLWRRIQSHLFEPTFHGLLQHSISLLEAIRGGQESVREVA